MITPVAGIELLPSGEMPDVYQVSNVDPALCRSFAQIALPLIIHSIGGEMYHVCDADASLSAVTDAIFAETVRKTGTFEGASYATLSGYNLPRSILGAGNSNGFHSDGCDEVAIVSINEKAYLHVAWVPDSDPDDEFLTHRYNPDDKDPVLYMSKGNEPVGYVRPVKIIECMPGTLVRIDQLRGSVEDEDGYTWVFMHGLYNAVGQRIALQFRSYDKGDSTITNYRANGAFARY